ncbi:MAG: potassium-transporting ATPase subunit F [Microcystaceae cyanobacterium]
MVWFKILLFLIISWINMMRSPTFRLTLKNLVIYLGILLTLNAVLAPLVTASTGSGGSKGQAYALIGLGLIAVSVFGYLLMVILQPEKF